MCYTKIYCALLESVASSVEKAAELRLSSLTDCLYPGLGRGTLLVTLCTFLVFGGTSVVLEGAPVFFRVLYWSLQHCSSEVRARVRMR